MLSIPWVFVVTASCNGGNHAHHLNDDWNWTSLRKSSTAKRLHSMHRYHTHGCHNSCCSRLYTKSAFWLMYADFDYVLYTSFTREAWHHADFNILSRFGKHSLKIGVSYCNHSLHCAQLNLLFFDHTHVHDIQIKVYGQPGTLQCPSKRHSCLPNFLWNGIVAMLEWTLYKKLLPVHPQTSPGCTKCQC